MLFDEIELLTEEELQGYVRSELGPWIKENFLQVANLPDDHPDGLCLEDIVFCEAGELPPVIKKLLEELFGSVSEANWVPNERQFP